ncbi:MAG TPA: putative sulfate exporter family transporter [Anaeromyxobacteraceae bacterium]|nr:putative sulfate exporter family transporter [Anaeromyxobacteraceae bacterium]
MIAGVAASLLPGVPAAAALSGGAVLALTAGNPLADRTRRLAKRLLPAAVVGLGGAMDLEQVLRAGARGFAYTVVSIGAAIALGTLLARAFGVDRRTGALVTVGTAICGGSAIAAAAPVMGAEERELSVALATVFLLNSIALLVFPPIGHLVGLGQPAFGLWAALAIHDTSSVVGAAMEYGSAALVVATTVKLARALWIVPVTLGLGALERRRGGASARRAGQPPWFIAGFLALAAVTTWVPALRPAGLLVAGAARQALVLTLFLVGLGLSRDGLREVGARPLLHGVALWVASAAASLAAVASGLIHP